MSEQVQPKRIQRKRAKDFRLADVVTNPNGYRCVTRGTAWGNPYRIGATYRNAVAGGLFEVTAENCLPLFELYAKSMLVAKPYWLKPLRGKDLACWCKTGTPCHADILLKLVNEDNERS